MNTPNSSLNDEIFLKRALETTIHIGVIVILVAWCFQIVQPFIIPIVWGIIIAVATYPGYCWLLTTLAERRRLAATLLTLFMLVALIVPSMMLTGTLVESVTALARDLGDGALTIPPPPQIIETWPVIGGRLTNFWSLASVNLQAALQQIAPQLKTFSAWLLSAAAGAGFALLQFIVAIVISGILLAYSENSYKVAHSIAIRLTGKRGPDFANLAETTIRSVARGILGVALFQSLLAGLGFLVAGVPAAGLWTLLCLLFSVIQIGVGVVIIPVLIYMFSTADTFTAVALLIWCIPVTLIDNILKPMLLGRGVKTPMIIIFIGAIGGFIASGIIGLFVGSVVLAFGYELFLTWLDQDSIAS